MEIGNRWTLYERFDERCKTSVSGDWALKLSLIKLLSRNGPYTDPCGTGIFQGVSSAECFSYLRPLVPVIEIATL